VKPAALLLFAALVLTAAPRSERYALILEDKPLAAGAPSRKDAVRSARRDEVASKQSAVAAALAEQHIRVTAAEQVLVNAIFVEAPANSGDYLRSLPGVAYVERLVPMKRHLTEALNLMNVPAAWSAVNGPQNAGAGVKIAILDTGIDQSHPAFQNSPLQYPAGFPKCEQSRGDCAYVNQKVIAARSYVNMLAGTDPATDRPDDLSPRDRVGHGTAVAMIAAGLRNDGPLGTITGVAPGAWLGNYKVFGSPGVNGQYTYDDVIIKALNDAFNDGMNVAVLSLGAPAQWGPRDVPPTCGENSGKPCDWRADAVENATKLGLTVVVSAGNDGDLATQYPAFNSVNTPGTAPAAITVGASTNSHIFYQSVRVQGPSVPADLTRINALFSDGPRPDGTVNAPLRDVAAAGNDGFACSAMGDGTLNGAIALIQRGNCETVLKINNAQRSGAIGVIIYQPEGVNGLFQIRGVDETGIPAGLIGNRNGVALKNYAAQQPEARITLDPAFTSISTSEFDTMAFFSSRGPSIRLNAIKPELLAVGTDLYTATQRYDPNGELYSPDGYTAAQGSSYAAPIVAGAVAMVKQRNPQMTPAQLKSTVVNTANPKITDFEGNTVINASVLDMGAGKLDANAALGTNVTAEPSTLSFGAIGNSLPPPTGLKLCNFSNGNLNLQLSVVPATGATASASVVLNNSNVSVDAGKCREDLTASLTGTKPAPGIYEGDIQITGGAVALHIPYLFLVGDGVPFSILPLQGDGFEGSTGSMVTLVFKVVDRYGVPIPGLNVLFQSTIGDGTISQEGKQTDDLGIGFADVVLGQQVGEQEFYAAVGDNRDFGIYFGGVARLKPSIAANGIVDFLTFEHRDGFAPGSYLTIFGQGLSAATRLFSTPYLPISLAAVSVSFDAPNVSVPARLTYVRDDQINVQVPWELQGASSAQMKVSLGDSSSSVVTVPIATYAPTLFFYDDGGRQSVLAQRDNALISSASPAPKGSAVTLYVSGLGPVNNQPASGEPAPSDQAALATTKVTPIVTIGGRPATIEYSGLAPGFVGLYQVNIRIPADAASGPQPLVISMNGIESKAVSIPIQ
jgi:uncharacterized protein (TIGR03437 family)